MAGIRFLGGFTSALNNTLFASSTTFAANLTLSSALEEIPALNEAISLVPVRDWDNRSYYLKSRGCPANIHDSP